MEQEKLFTCICIPAEQHYKILDKLRADVSKKCNSKNVFMFPVHFSLRNDFKVKAEDVPALMEALDTAAKHIKCFDINTSHYGFFPWKIVYLKIEKNPFLQNLHQQVLKTIQEFRTPWISDYLLNSLQYYEDKQLEYIKTYGYQFALEFYSSHFTLAGNDMSEQSFTGIQADLGDMRLELTIPIEKFILLEREHNTIAAEFRLQP